MTDCVRFSIGVLARLLAVIGERYAGWLLHKISEGQARGCDFLADLRDFGSWLMEWAASRMAGGRRFLLPTTTRKAGTSPTEPAAVARRLAFQNFVPQKDGKTRK